MNQGKPPQQIIQQGLALDTYLRTLLDEIPEETASIVNDPVIEIIATPPTQHATPVSTIELPSTVVLQPVQAADVPAKIQALSVMPEWTQQEFQALFFKVDHLILATPLIELSRTIKIQQKPTKIPGQPSWFMGLLDLHDSRIGVLDTGQLVFGKTRGSQRNLELQPFKCILVTQDKKWGLACDEILSIGKLVPEKVRWRTNRKTKTWLIGTIIEELTAIVDIRQLVPHRKVQKSL